MKTPDLTKHPPRSPRVLLGGFVLLPRTLDKARATIAGKNGEYHFNCPLDAELLKFIGIAPARLKRFLLKPRTDADVLNWIQLCSHRPRSSAEIRKWSKSQVMSRPLDAESKEIFAQMKDKVAPHRDDIETWFDLLDVDDFVTFGGTA